MASTTPSSALPLSRMALNLMTVGTGHPFDQVLDACVRRGIGIVSPWQDHYASAGVKHAAQALRDRNMRVNTLCRIAGFGEADTPAAWQKALDDAYRTIDEAVMLGATSITVIGGGLAAGSKDIVASRERISDSIQTLMPRACSAGVALAIEPLHPMVAANRGAINTLDQALQIAIEAGAGVMVDAYNSWWDPNLSDSIGRAKGYILGFQVADWLVPTTDLAFDRGMPGDGVIDLPAIRAMVEAADYHGPIEIEVLSSHWSGLALDDVLKIVLERWANC
ncbi:MAG: sugar phosphate isomerase/epimerase family protein [Burkholderiaceae bacterium]